MKPFQGGIKRLVVSCKSAEARRSGELRSTIQRRGSNMKPRLAIGCLTTSRRKPCCCAASAAFGPA